MVEQVALTLPDAGIGQRGVNLERACGHPLAILPVTAVLCDFADVDFRVEVGGESLAVVSGIAVDDVEGLHLREIVLGRVSGEHP